MARDMLVIHESQVISKIIKAYALAELNDIRVETVESAEEALYWLNSKKYDMVLSAMQMARINGLEIYRRMKATDLNPETPFLIVTATSTPAQKRVLAEHGIKYYLFTPFNAKDMANMINEASNPREKRAYDRYSIPGVEAIIHFEKFNLNVKVLNISLAGILCEIIYQHRYPRPLRPFKLDIDFPEEYGGIKAEDIMATLLRMSVLSWREDHVPNVMRVAYKFVEVPKAAAEIIEQALNKARKDLTLSHVTLDCEAECLLI